MLKLSRAENKNILVKVFAYNLNFTWQFSLHYYRTILSWKYFPLKTSIYEWIYQILFLIMTLRHDAISWRLEQRKMKLLLLPSSYNSKINDKQTCSTFYLILKSLYFFIFPASTLGGSAWRKLFTGTMKLCSDQRPIFIMTLYRLHWRSEKCKKMMRASIGEFFEDTAAH